MNDFKGPMEGNETISSMKIGTVKVLEEEEGCSKKKGKLERQVFSLYWVISGREEGERVSLHFPW